jgi:hypothetical protein
MLFSIYRKVTVSKYSGHTFVCLEKYKGMTRDNRASINLPTTAEYPVWRKLKELAYRAVFPTKEQEQQMKANPGSTAVNGAVTPPMSRTVIYSKSESRPVATEVRLPLSPPLATSTPAAKTHQKTSCGWKWQIFLPMTGEIVQSSNELILHKRECFRLGCEILVSDYLDVNIIARVRVAAFPIESPEDQRIMNYAYDFCVLKRVAREQKQHQASAAATADAGYMFDINYWEASTKITKHEVIVMFYRVMAYMKLLSTKCNMDELFRASIQYCVPETAEDIPQEYTHLMTILSDNSPRPLLRMVKRKLSLNQAITDDQASTKVAKFENFGETSTSGNPPTRQEEEGEQQQEQEAPFAGVEYMNYSSPAPDSPPLVDHREIRPITLCADISLGDGLTIDGLDPAEVNHNENDTDNANESDMSQDDVFL